MARVYFSPAIPFKVGGLDFTLVLQYLLRVVRVYFSHVITVKGGKS